jgi:hypothetical protein
MVDGFGCFDCLPECGYLEQKVPCRLVWLSWRTWMSILVAYLYSGCSEVPTEIATDQLTLFELLTLLADELFAPSMH